MATEQEPRSYRVLRSARMDALSDGVYAIAITLLVLDLGTPSAAGEQRLLDALIDQWPAYLAYVVSFASIGAAWIAHTTISECLDGADSTLLRLNLLSLLFVGFLPYPTRLVGEFIGDSGAERVAVTLYGVNLLLVMLTTYLLWVYARRRGLVSARLPAEDVEDLTRRLRPGVGGYAFLIAAGIFWPRAAVIGYLLLAVVLLAPFAHLRRRRPDPKAVA